MTSFARCFALVSSVLCLGPTACGRSEAIATSDIRGGVSGPPTSGWSAPVAVAAVNTPALEFANAISKDGLHLYFQRGDALASGEDIWVAHRESREAEWGTPERLPDTVNSTFNDRAAYVSADGHWLLFSSDRPGGRGGSDLMVSWRAHTHDETGWEPAINLDLLGAPINTAGFDSGPALFQNDEAGTEELFFVSNPTGTQAFADVYRSVRNPDGSFGPPAPVAELNSPASEGRPYLSHSGMEIYFQSNRPGGQGGLDLWVATRASVFDAWSPPEPVLELATAGNEVTPVLSWDGLTLYFAVNRPGEAGQIYEARRQKLRGSP